jgi:hypothetical protein
MKTNTTFELDPSDHHIGDPSDLAVRMAIGSCRVGTWRAAKDRYKAPIGGLFRQLKPEEQALARAWELILTAPPEPLACDGHEIYRKGTVVISDYGDNPPTVPAVVAGFLSYVSREVDWQASPAIHGILYPESCDGDEEEDDGPIAEDDEEDDDGPVAEDDEPFDDDYTNREPDPWVTFRVPASTVKGELCYGIFVSRDPDNADYLLLRTSIPEYVERLSACADAERIEPQNT